MRTSWTSRCGAVVVAMAACLIQAASGPVDGTLPKGMEGFRGTLTGTVTMVFTYNQGIQMEVTKVDSDADSKASNPNVAVGKKICVDIKYTTKDGKTVLDPTQRDWVKGLKEGQTVKPHVAENGKGDLVLQEVPK